MKRKKIQVCVSSTEHLDMIRSPSYRMLSPSFAPHARVVNAPKSGIGYCICLHCGSTEIFNAGSDEDLKRAAQIYGCFLRWHRTCPEPKNYVTKVALELDTGSEVVR